VVGPAASDLRNLLLLVSPRHDYVLPTENMITLRFGWQSRRCRYQPPSWRP
jgi:hypothetical protein